MCTVCQERNYFNATQFKIKVLSGNTGQQLNNKIKGRRVWNATGRMKSSTEMKVRGKYVSQRSMQLPRLKFGRDTELTEVYFCGDMWIRCWFSICMQKLGNSAVGHWWSTDWGKDEDQRIILRNFPPQLYSAWSGLETPWAELTVVQGKKEKKKQCYTTEEL